MDNKTINNDDYDLILEEKEKERKKEKRNKIILGSSLSLLLLLGSTAVVAPIISVAVDKNNSANINNINVPSTLTFTNSDITTLLDGYKSEIQDRKLSLKQFENNLVNITKKYIVASNIEIGSIVQSVTFIENQDSQMYSLNITLEESDKREYLTSEDFSEATLTKNVLTIKIEEVDKVLGQFYTQSEIINSNKLNELPQLIKDYINKDRLTKQNFNEQINNNTLKNQIGKWLGPNFNVDEIGSIRYEEPKLIIEPKPFYTFVSDFNTDLIVNGNIEISNVKLYRLIKFINLNNYFQKLNDIIHSINGNKTSPEDFKKYLEDTHNKETIYNNLEIANNESFSIDNILNIYLDYYDDSLVIELNDSEDSYLIYEIEKNNNFTLKNNKLEIKNLNFHYEPNTSESDFIIRVEDLYNKAGNLIYKAKSILRYDQNIANKKDVILPKKIINDQDVDIFVHFMFYNTAVESVNMINVNDFWGEIWWKNNNTKIVCEKFFIAYSMFEDCRQLKKVILPKTTKVIGRYAFENCISLEKIKLPNGLNEIQDYCFTKSGLKSLEIPESVTKIGYRIFSTCENIEWIKISSKINDLDQESFTSFRDITIYVPTQELKDYYDSLNLNRIKEVIVGEPPAN
ncbi:MAG: leucine-rich repeat domain-containing protein [Ureaplasma sp.]|nr:leucine-rich repeat domain-containing protein [Ureaplasma sp.]